MEERRAVSILLVVVVVVALAARGLYHEIWKFENSSRSLKIFLSRILVIYSGREMFELEIIKRKEDYVV